MSGGAPTEAGIQEPDFTPMLDMTFLLTFFFALTANFVQDQQFSGDIDLPVAQFAGPLTPDENTLLAFINLDRDGVMRTLIARGLIAEAGTDPGTNATTYVTTELFLERLGLASLADLPPLAPLLPDVDVIDDISEDMESDPRFAKLRAARTDTEPVVDTGVDARAARGLQTVAAGAARNRRRCQLGARITGARETSRRAIALSEQLCERRHGDQGRRVLVVPDNRVVETHGARKNAELRRARCVVVQGGDGRQAEGARQ